MGDPGLPGRIQKRIFESKRTYTRQQQIAELLLRNNDFVTLAQHFRESGRGSDSSSWEGFASGWSVGADWDGNAETLENHIRVKPELECLSIRKHSIVRYRINQDILCGKSSKLGTDRPRPDLATLEIPIPGEEPITLVETYPWLDKPWAELVPCPTEIIYIRIGPTIQKQDLQRLWPTIARLKKEFFGYSDREKRAFSRALCWYDLHKDEKLGNLSFGQIRNRWPSHYPTEKPPSRVAIQKAIERIEQTIRRLRPLYGGFPPIFSLSE